MLPLPTDASTLYLQVRSCSVAGLKMLLAGPRTNEPA
jgi:hypothetical protein